jgi:hypothetical protein
MKKKRYSNIKYLLGINKRFIGREHYRKSDDSFVAFWWITYQGFPIWPVGAYRIQRLNVTKDFLGGGTITDRIIEKYDTRRVRRQLAFIRAIAILVGSCICLFFLAGVVAGIVIYLQ